MYRYDVGHVHPAGRAIRQDSNRVIGDMGLDIGSAPLGDLNRRDLDNEPTRTDRYMYIDDFNPENENNEENNNDDDRDQVAIEGKVSTRSRSRSRSGEVDVDVDVDVERDYDYGFGAGGFEYPDEPFNDDPQHGSDMFRRNMNPMSSSSHRPLLPISSRYQP